VAYSEFENLVRFNKGGCEVESIEITQVWWRALAGMVKVLVFPSTIDGLSKIQILFYANAGTPKDASGSEAGGYVSLFLACEVRR
jgi:hypothetical protein